MRRTYVVGAVGIVAAMALAPLYAFGFTEAGTVCCVVCAVAFVLLNQ